MNKSVNSRNSLLELYRFLFALWVLYYHSYVPYKFSNGFFNGGYVAVEFFFILSGFFMLRTFEKFIDDDFIKGSVGLIVKVIKPLGITLLIGLLFSVWYNILHWESLLNLFYIYGYLWYVARLLDVTVLFFIMFRFIKNETARTVLLTCIFVICAALYDYKVGILRALGSISLGILLSKVPGLNFKNFKITNTIKSIGLTASICYCFVMALLPYNSFLHDSSLYILGFTSLIYFSSQITVSNIYLNYLGKLSFGIYAYQCVTRVLECYGLISPSVSFAIIMCLCVLDKKRELIDLIKVKTSSNKHNNLQL